MKKRILVDTNVILRFILFDNKQQGEAASELFEKAKQGKIELKVISLVVIEVIYVLTKMYKVPKSTIVQTLTNLCSLEGVSVKDRQVLEKALIYWEKTSISFVDSWIICLAETENIEFVTFDKKMKK